MSKPLTSHSVSRSPSPETEGSASAEYALRGTLNLVMNFSLWATQRAKSASFPWAALKCSTLNSSAAAKCHCTPKIQSLRRPEQSTCTWSSYGSGIAEYHRCHQTFRFTRTVLIFNTHRSGELCNGEKYIGNPRRALREIHRRENRARAISINQ